MTNPPTPPPEGGDDVPDDVTWGASDGPDAPPVPSNAADQPELDAQLDALGIEPTELLPAAGVPTAAAVAADATGELSITQQIRRRKVSRRRYLMRRAMVGAGIFALVAGAVVGVIALTSGDDPNERSTLGAAPGGSDPPNAVVADSTEAPDVGAGSTTSTEAAATSAPTTDAPVTTAAVPSTTEAEASTTVIPLPVSSRPAATTTTSTSTTEVEATTTSTSRPRQSTTTAPTSANSEASASTEVTDSTEVSDSTEVADSADVTDTTDVTDSTDVTDTTETVDSTEPGDERYDLDKEPDCEVGGGAGIGTGGADVLCIKQRLEEVTIGGVDFEIDNIFDEELEVAVREFQAYHDLVVDGIVGPQTASMLRIWPGSNVTADSTEP